MKKTFASRSGAFHRRGVFRSLIGTVLLFLSTHLLPAAVFNIGPGDVAGLISAINTANTNNQNDTITLTAGSTYTLTTVDNSGARGENGLPVIGADNSHNLTIDGGTGATITREGSSPAFRIFQIAVGANATIGGLTISGGRGSNFGGGGVFIDHGILSVLECHFSGNGGSGIENFGGTLTATSSTFSNNNSDGETTIGGGAIANFGTATVKNCTFRANTAIFGSAVYNNVTLNLYSCTFSGDHVLHNRTGTLTIGNTILDNPSFSNPPFPIVNDNGGSVTSLGYNLCKSTDPQFLLNGPGDQTATDPRLDPLGLRDNGGPTPTIALLSDSPAIDQGKSFGLTSDQRGFVRPFDLPAYSNAAGGDGSDIGAVESLDPVQAGSTFLITTTQDHDDGSCTVGDCTLRDAIVRANALTGANTITFENGVTGTITLSSELGVSDSLVINGPGARTLALSGNQVHRVFNFSGGSNSISGLTIRNGAALGVPGSGRGGGIYNAVALTVTDCTLSGNLTTGYIGTQQGEPGGFARGGAVSNDGTLALVRCALSGNSVQGGKGANSSAQPGNGGAGGAGQGGAVFNNTSATLTITNCTLSGNSATGGNGGNDSNTRGGNGGDAFGSLFNQGTMTMTACTVSGNTGAGGTGGVGGGGMTAANGIGRGGLAASAGTSTLRNTISAGNAATDAFGSFSSSGYNLIGNGTGSSGITGPADQVGTSGTPINAQLGPLQNNGGPTDTMALLTGGPALDQGKGFGLTIDQRSSTRPIDAAAVANANGGDGSDIGAFEKLDVGPIATPTPTATPTTPTPTPTPTTSPSTLANISTRLRVETGDNALIGGFIITGTQDKKVIIRAIGPSLALPDKLANPTLELRNSSGTLLKENDDWMNSSPADLQAIIDSTIPPSNDLESAIVATLTPNQNYTAVVRGVNNGTGIGVVEAYDLDRSVDSKFANISTRGFVQTGDNVLIAGTIVLGSATQQVIVRAIGPSLPISGKLENPTLELRDASGTLLEANDNWVDSPNKQAIIDSTIPPGNDLESAIVRTLSPANYTAVVRGVNDTTGIAVVEVYALD